jgi:hypothetical protein
VTAKGKRFMEWLRQQPCAVTGQLGVQAAHIEGCISEKTGLVLPRRMGPAVDYALPLAPELHLVDYPGSIHSMGERAFFEEHDLNPHQLVATYHCRHLHEGGR